MSVTIDESKVAERQRILLALQVLQAYSLVLEWVKR